MITLDLAWLIFALLGGALTVYGFLTIHVKHYGNCGESIERIWGNLPRAKNDILTHFNGFYGITLTTISWAGLHFATALLIPIYIPVIYLIATFVMYVILRDLFFIYTIRMDVVKWCKDTVNSNRYNNVVTKENKGDVVNDEQWDKRLIIWDNDLNRMFKNIWFIPVKCKNKLIKNFKNRMEERLINKMDNQISCCKKLNQEMNANRERIKSLEKESEDRRNKGFNLADMIEDILKIPSEMKDGDCIEIRGETMYVNGHNLKLVNALLNRYRNDIINIVGIGAHNKNKSFREIRDEIHG